METKQLVAALAAWLAFATWARLRHRWRRYRRDNPHSPIGAATVWDWIKQQVSPDPDPDTDTEPDTTVPTATKRGYRLRQVSATTTVVDHIEPGDELPPATPTSSRTETQLHIWIRRSFEIGARYSDVVRDGRRLFGTSEASMKRAIRQVRGARR